MIDPVADQQKRAENYDFMSDMIPYFKNQAQLATQKFKNISSGASDFISDATSALKGKFKVTQKFGNYNPSLYSGITKGSKHLGVDLATPEGTDVFAPSAGNVSYGKDKNWGNYADLTLPDGTVVRFSHLSQTGQNGTVKQGQGIAKTGNTGHTTGAHLDISAKKKGQYIDPTTLSWLSQMIGG